jgi:V/A-type H+-transporting ATPase subunit K
MEMSLIEQYFTSTGIGWAMIGAIGAVMFGGIGSARGIGLAASEAAGAIAEKPDMFGKALILAALPGTQGLYGFVTAFILMFFTGVIGDVVAVSPLVGFTLMFVGLLSGVVQWKSGVHQGEVSAACINLTVKRPEEAGRAIVLPVLVETYAVVALLAAILISFFLTSGTLEYTPAADLFKAASGQ